MKNSTYSRRNHTVSTVKKSQARIPAACWPAGAGTSAMSLVSVVARGPSRGGAGFRGWRSPRPAHQAAGVRPECAGTPQRGFSPACGRSGPVGPRPAAAAASTVRVGPCAGDQAAVPAQQRLWLDEKAGPAGPWQQAADGGEQGTVGGLQPGSWDLAPQDGELVAEHQDLQVPWRSRHGRAGQAVGWSGTARGRRVWVAPGWPLQEGRGGTAEQHHSSEAVVRANLQLTEHVGVFAPHAANSWTPCIDRLHTETAEWARTRPSGAGRGADPRRVGRRAPRPGRAEGPDVGSPPDAVRSGGLLRCSLGDGARLFDNLGGEIELEQVRAVKAPASRTSSTG
jgi:hypothetical protein